MEPGAPTSFPRTRAAPARTWTRSRLRGTISHRGQVDFVIVCISLLVLLADSIPQLRPLRVLRVMRVLRPLRLISRNAGMKLIITSLFKALPAVANVFGVVLALQTVFAILGMQVRAPLLPTCRCLPPASSLRRPCVAPASPLCALLQCS